MRYKYQLILLGENVEFFEKLKLEISRKFDELKLIQDLLKIITKDNISEYSGAEPAYVIYSGHKNNLDVITNEIIEQQKLGGNIILPIFIENFTKEIPDVISNLNGLKLHDNISKICNLILEGFELLRKSVSIR